MNTKGIIRVLFLLAFPASGKSEIRAYMAHLTDEERAELGLGRLVQLDDYPYVALTRMIDRELADMKFPPAFYQGDQDPFLDKRFWLVLNQLVANDYADLVAEKFAEESGSAAEYFLDRIAKAAKQVGVESQFISHRSSYRRDLCSGGYVNDILRTIEPEARKMLDERMKNASGPLDGATIVVEFSRGGREDARFPLEFGYEAALAMMPHDMLVGSAILYVDVTPEESRRKNMERAVKIVSDDGLTSTFSHCVPPNVMEDDYGKDDIGWMNGEDDDRARIYTRGLVYVIPVGTFHNMPDVTSPLRATPATWTREIVDSVREGMDDAMAVIRSAYIQEDSPSG